MIREDKIRLKTITNYLMIFGIFLLVFSGCKKDDQSQADKDDEIIRQYLTDNNLQATKHSSGLYYIITKEGTGDHPSANATVKVNYKGYFTNDQVFDQTTNKPIEFPLQNLIKGWQFGIPLLKKDGEGTFFLPSALGYGSQTWGNIPANSVLIFEIELLDFS